MPEGSPKHIRPSKGLFGRFRTTKDEPSVVDIRSGKDGIDPLTLLDDIDLEQQAPDHQSNMDRSLEYLVGQLKGIHPRRRPLDESTDADPAV